MWVKSIQTAGYNGAPMVYEFLALHISAINSFSNPKVLAIIAKLQKAVIRLGPFSEPSNFEGALAPLAPPLSLLLLMNILVL